MEMVLKNILTSIICIAISSGIATFIVKKLFEHRLNKNLTKFNKVYVDQVETIKEFYRKLVKAEKALNLLMSHKEPSDNEQKKDFVDNTFVVINDLIKYFEENELLFEQSTVLQVKQIIEKIGEAKVLQINAEMLENNRGSEAWLIAINNKQSFFDRTLKNDFPILREKLKNDFQKKYSLILT